MLKKINILSLLTFVFIFSQGITLEAQEDFSLEEAVQYAYDKSEQLQLDKLDVEDARGQIREYWSTGIPKLNLSGQYQHSPIIPAQLLPGEFLGGAPGEYVEVRFGLKNSVTGTLEFNTLIFSGSFFVGLKAQKLYKRLTVKQLDVSKAEIRSNVHKAYINVLLAQKMLNVLQDNLTVLESSLDQVRESYEAGFQEKLDVDQIELSYRNLQTEIETSKSSLLIARNLLKFQMGYPLDKAIKLTNELDGLTEEVQVNKYEEKADLAISNRPEWETFEVREKLNEVNIRSIKASYLPRLDGFANYQQRLSRDNLFDENGPAWIESAVAGVSLSMPIFDGLDRSARIQRAQVDLQRVEVQKNQFERSVRMEVENNKLNMTNARKRLNSAQESLELARTIYNTTQKKFNEGVGSSFELTQAEQELYDAQRSYFNAMYELFIAYTDLQKSLGTL